MGIRLAAGGPNERVKNDKAEEEEVTSFKVKSADY